MLSESPIPLYYQVANVLRHRILDGAYHRGERIGSEADICEQFGVSRITVRQALDGLEGEGLVVRRRGLGTFVSEQIPQAASISFTGYLEDLFAQVLLTESRDVRIEQVPAEKEVARALQVGEEETVVRIERVRLLRDRPLAHTVNYLPVSLGASISADDLQEIPLMHLLEHRLGVYLEEAVQTIRAVLASPHLANQLSIHEGAPLLLVERVCYAKGRPVEYVLTHFRADRYQYSVRLGRIKRNTNRPSCSEPETGFGG